MEKDYWNWHYLKASLENIPKYPFFREKEVWLSSLGLNLGYEQDGKHERFLRPVLIIKKFNRDIFWAVPLTSIEKRGFYYHRIKFSGRSSSVILSQLRLMDQRRLFKKMGTISPDDFVAIKKRLVGLLS